MSANNHAVHRSERADRFELRIFHARPVTAAVLPLKRMRDLDSIQISPGARHCIHLRRGCDARDLAAALARSPSVDSGVIRVATNPDPRTLWTRLFGMHPVSKWMASKLGCTQADAKSRISRLPVPVHEQFNCNAFNPMRFLGFVLAANDNPLVLIYETSGMDPRGRKLLHEYAPKEYFQGTLINVSSVPVDVCDLAIECKYIDL